MFLFQIVPASEVIINPPACAKYFRLHPGKLCSAGFLIIIRPLGSQSQSLSFPAFQRSQPGDGHINFRGDGLEAVSGGVEGTA